jgi:hypothetical protein
MQLNLAEPTERYPILRLVSKENQWEMGIHRYPALESEGLRVSCGRIGSSIYLKGGYVCGVDGYLLKETTLALIGIVSSWPESMTNEEADRSLPTPTDIPKDPYRVLSRLQRDSTKHVDILSSIQDPRTNEVIVECIIEMGNGLFGWNPYRGFEAETCQEVARKVIEAQKSSGVENLALYEVD